MCVYALTRMCVYDVHIEPRECVGLLKLELQRAVYFHVGVGNRTTVFSSRLHFKTSHFHWDLHKLGFN